jgi:hypothetical protein
MSSQLKNKLLHYELQPPEGVWSKIAASLDENLSVSVSEKLYHYEEEPSTKVWQSIVSELQLPDREEAKVVPFYIRYRRPLKYSGAIAIFIFLAILTSLFISKKTESELPPKQAATTATTKKDSSKPAENPNENNSATQAPQKTKTQRLIARSKASKESQDEVQNFSTASLESFLPQQAEKNDIVSSPVSSDKYMIYSDEDGNVVRLPKKIFSAFACPTDDAVCRQRLQQLKEKFAQSAMTADFTGLLQILNSLQENQ